MNKVFLGGTCAESTWRDELIPLLDGEYFNPFVDDWTTECQQIEEYEKDVNCNIHLYVITSEMIGVFSIAEVIESVHMDSKITIFHVIPEGFSSAQIMSLIAVAGIVKNHGGIIFTGDIGGSALIIKKIINELK